MTIQKNNCLIFDDNKGDEELEHQSDNHIICKIKLIKGLSNFYNFFFVVFQMKFIHFII